MRIIALVSTRFKWKTLAMLLYLWILAVRHVIDSSLSLFHLFPYSEQMFRFVSFSEAVSQSCSEKKTLLYKIPQTPGKHQCWSSFLIETLWKNVLIDLGLIALSISESNNHNINDVVICKDVFVYSILFLSECLCQIKNTKASLKWFAQRSYIFKYI